MQILDTLNQSIYENGEPVEHTVFLNQSLLQTTAMSLPCHCPYGSRPEIVSYSPGGFLKISGKLKIIIRVRIEHLCSMMG